MAGVRGERDADWSIAEARGPPANCDHHADRGARDRPPPLAVLRLAAAAPKPDHRADGEHRDDDPGREMGHVLEGRRRPVRSDGDTLKRGPYGSEDPDADDRGADREAEEDHPGADRALAETVPGAARATARDDHTHTEEHAPDEIRGPVERADRNLDEPGGLEDL